MPDKSIRILPLGGLGEIGKNMYVVEYDDRIVVVDTGLMFPTSDMLGIDLVLPDYSYLRERADDIEAIVLTHGHEDHVGALPYLRREIDVPVIYGGGLTVGMVRSKLDEHGLKDAPLQQIDPGEPTTAGPFEIETVQVSHSIPDAAAVLLTTEAGSVLVTGDYKFDQTPVDGRPTDMTRLARIGEEGLLVLCGDSTNADRKGFTMSETSVGPELERVFSHCSGRIVLTSFASNVHRVQQAIDCAEKLDRKVCVIGRSMKKYLNVAKNLGIAHVPEGIMVQPREIDDFDKSKLVVISTGSQGEPLSALRRMANGEHKQISLDSNDTVIFSATAVPGNELAVNQTIDRLFHIGCDVITAADAPIHASGHGCAEELKMMLNLTKPRYVMPVHGDYKRLKHHAELAEATGVERERVFIGENGMPLAVNKDRAEFDDSVGAGMIFVDGADIGAESEAALRDRHTLSADGLIIVVATVPLNSDREIETPSVIFRGIPFIDNESELADKMADRAEQTLARASKEGIKEIGLLQELLHDDVSTLANKLLKRRPMVIPVVLEI